MFTSNRYFFYLFLGEEAEKAFQKLRDRYTRAKKGVQECMKSGKSCPKSSKQIGWKSTLAQENQKATFYHRKKMYQKNLVTAKSFEILFQSSGEEWGLTYSDKTSHKDVHTSVIIWLIFDLPNLKENAKSR